MGKVADSDRGWKVLRDKELIMRFEFDLNIVLEEADDRQVGAGIGRAFKMA